MNNRITLVIPGLATLAPAPTSFDRLPGLRRLLRYASVVEAPPDFGTLLWQRAGGTGTCPAVAPVTRLADGGRQDTDWWLRADPVCLVVGAADATLIARPGATAGEATQLVASIGAHLCAEGYEIEAPTADRWYLRCPAAFDACTVPPGLAARDGVAATLPSGPDGGRLAALMTEVQMLLHDHPVNQLRLSRAVPLVNAVWLWGGGRMPVPGSLAGDRPALVSNDPYARGLWALAGDEPGPVPDTCDKLTEDGGDRLVVLDSADVSLRDLDRAWIEPLVAWLRAGRIDRLELIDAGTCLVLRRTDEGSWFRRLGTRLRSKQARWPWST